MRTAAFTIAAILVLACPSALADGYQLSFLGPTGDLNDAGQYYQLSWTNSLTNTSKSENVYYGPYSMRVTDQSNSSSQVLALVCLDGAINFDGNAVYFSSNTGVTNNAALSIASRMLSGDYDSAAELVGMNLALWTLMDATNQIRPGSVTFTSTYGGANDIAAALLTSAPSMAFSGSYTIYTPQSTPPSQRFLLVPEPSLILLLGMGLGAVALIGCRFSRK